MSVVRRAVTASHRDKIFDRSTLTMANANIISVKNGRLAIDVGLDEKGKESSTGKSTVHFSSGGFTDVDGSDYRVNLTVIKKLRK